MAFNSSGAGVVQSKERERTHFGISYERKIGGANDTCVQPGGEGIDNLE